MRRVLFPRMKIIVERFAKDVYLQALLALISAYVIIFSYLSVLKYYAFKASVLDLGLYNQVYWLTLRGGPALWNQSANNFYWQYPYHKLSFVLFLPFYAIFPHPETLLLLQSVVFGLAAIPLFYLGVRHGLGRRFALLVSFAYLAYYPTQDANLFDLHPEALWSLFFFLTVYFWESGNRGWFAICAVIAALVDPLSLLTMQLFLLFAIYSRHDGHWSSALNLRSLTKLLRSRSSEVSLFFGLSGIFILESYAGLIYPYLGSASSLQSGTVGAAGGIDLVPLLITNPGSKIQYFTILLAPIAFLPLLDPLTWVLSIPFGARVLFSRNSALWQAFGLQYPISWAPILFFGLLRSLSKLSSLNHVQQDLSLGIKQERILRRVGVLLLVSTLVFAAIYSPLGPLNPFVNGGYGAGNEDLSGIIHPNANAVFLYKLVRLVPADASVLTQNDIPQLSGRFHFQVISPLTGPPVVPYDYILANSESPWFDGMQKYINAALQNKTFGILGMGYGAILLERGYTGSPMLFVPVSQVWSAGLLPVYSGYIVTDLLIHNASQGNAPFFWYGPYLTLVPGTYLVNFTLMVQDVSPPNVPIVTLDVVSGANPFVYPTYAIRTIVLGDFTASARWETFTLQFTLTAVTQGVEFRGVSVTNATTIALSNISLYQVGPP